MELMQALIDAERKNRLGHALLFSLPAGSIDDCWSSFEDFVGTLLCSDSDTKACKRCESCRLFYSEKGQGQHPDFFISRPEKEHAYSVEQIREGMKKFSYSRAIAAKRIWWIAEAHALSGSRGASANALLKVLEEPRPESLIVLSTRRPGALLGTIQSRCQHFRPQIQMPTSQLLGQDSEWRPLFAWLKQGAPAGIPFDSPLGDASFWKQKESALKKCEEFFALAWKEIRSEWLLFDREAALRVNDFFKAFETFINSLKQHAHAPLQASALRVQAMEGLLWKQ